MARIASQMIGGFYPTPDLVVERLAKSLVPSEPSEYLTIVDPCAGEGVAVHALASAHEELKVHIYTAELELARVGKLESLKRGFHRGYSGQWSWSQFDGDAFHLRWKKNEYNHGAGVLFLNPPYDHDRECGRLEEKFLRRFHEILAEEGVLLFLVPGYALTASAETLATHFSDISCFRFPGALYNTFKQVVLIAKRKHRGDEFEVQSITRQIREWAASAESLPELPESLEVIFPSSSKTGLSDVEMCGADITRIAKSFRPWVQTLRGGANVTVKSVFPDASLESNRGFVSATPPRPAHIAAALAAGVFNGSSISPDSQTSGLPDLLVKGVFRRSFKTVEEKFNKDGDLTGEIQVQQPELQITVMKIDTGEYVDLVPTAEASDETDVTDRFTTGDLLIRYGNGLLANLVSQCSIIYNPADRSHHFPFPAMRRPLYSAQEHAARALLKLMGGDTTVPMSARAGTAAVLLGEIGSGKSGTSLAVGKAMGAKHILVMCPSHLLDSWRDQANAVWPELGVMYLKTPQDVDSFVRSGGPVLGVMSKESAKLGSRVEAVPESCPGCGRSLPNGDLALKRASCKHDMLTPLDPAARLYDMILHHSFAWLPEDAFSAGMHVYSGFQHRSRVSLGLANDVSEDELNARTHGLSELPDIRAAAESLIEHAVAIPISYERKKQDPLKVAARAFHFIGDHRWARSLLERLYTENNTAHDGDSTDHYRQRLIRQNIRELAIFATESPQDAIRWSESFPMAEASGIYGRSCRNESSEMWSDLSGYRYASIMDFKHGKHGLLLESSGVAAGPSSYGAMTALRQALWSFGNWKSSGQCGEALWNHIPEPRRVPLATYFCRSAPRNFEFLFLADEAHEQATEGTAVELAAHRIIARKQPTILLTGSIMNGYAESLFTNWWALFHDFRHEFARTAKSLFVDRYGFRKRFVPVDDRKSVVVGRGSMSDRKEIQEKDRGTAPGVMPEFLLKHLLPHCVTLQRSDFGDVIQPCAIGIPSIKPAKQQIVDHNRLMTTLLDEVKHDRFDPDLSGALWGQLAEAPSQLDRCTSDTGNSANGDWVSRYPERVRDIRPDKDIVCRIAGYDPNALMPKEEWLINLLRSEFDAKRNCMIFGWHTEVFPRYSALIERELRVKPVTLLAEKVIPAKRQEWIQRKVVDARAKVMIVNPVAVQTGLNNLVHFSTAIFMENPACNPIVFRQAIGRLDRIGQSRPVKIFLPVYDGTAQSILSELLMRKVGISQSVDGVDSSSALRAVGVGEGYLTSLSVGKILYERMMGTR